jgi:hypothetical protein
MKKDKIINGFCYLSDEDTMVFISLYTERRYNYEAQLFSRFIKDYKITDKNIILSYEENGSVTPLFKAVHTGKLSIEDTDFDELIVEVYGMCTAAVKKVD